MRRSILVIIMIALSLVIIFSVVPAALAQSGVTVKTLDTLRLRSGPGTQFGTVASVPPGVTLPALARDNTSGWIAVNYSGQSGWLMARYLQVTGNLAVLPVGAANGVPTPAPAGPVDGSIVALDRYASTANAEYFRLVYLSDGLKIAGFYAEPKGDGPFPAVIYNRGGERASGALTGMELAPFAELGIVVVASQYRGGRGSEGWDHFGGDDVRDVINLIPLLKSRPKVDPNRIGMTGSSRGAMMTYLALKDQAQRRASDIKVASTTSGLADLIGWAAQRKDLDAGFFPEVLGFTTKQNPSAFRERSAIYWPALIRVPLLMQHGDADPAVSVSQSQRLYRLMGSRGGSVKLIIHKGDGHGLPNSEEGLPETFKWFSKYLAKPGQTFDYYGNKGAIRYAYELLRPR